MKDKDGCRVLQHNPRWQTLFAWFARAAVGLVFAANIGCALAFILQPELYAPGFEVSGLPGRMAVQGFGILFLMWNVTYPPVMIDPVEQKALFAVILVQQTIGVVGETALLLSLPAGHPALLNTGYRFTVFDGSGLILMALAYGLLIAADWKAQKHAV